MEIICVSHRGRIAERCLDERKAGFTFPTSSSVYFRMFDGTLYTKCKSITRKYNIIIFVSVDGVKMVFFSSNGVNKWENQINVNLNGK